MVGVWRVFSLLLGSMSLQLAAVPPTRPVPPVWPDHRFLLDYEPHRQVMAAEWWCNGYKYPSIARFENRYYSIRDASGRFGEVKYEIRLLKLTVHGNLRRQ